MDKFLGIPGLPELNQDEINYLNIPIISSEIEAVNLKISQLKKSRARWVQSSILPDRQRRSNSTFLKLFCKTKTAGTLPNYFYKATITIAKIMQRPNNKKKTIGQYPLRT